MRHPQPIHSDADHAAAVEEMERLWKSEPGNPDHDRLQVLGVLVDAYENSRWPVDTPDPAKAVKARI